MNASNDDFLITSRDHVPEPTCDLHQRKRPTVSARRRNDAVTAALLAARLHAQREGCSASNPWFECPARPVAIAVARRRGMRLGIGERDRREQVVLELIGNDVSHIREVTELTRTSGRVAA